MSYDTGSILLRRGPTVDRLAFVPLTGEIIYDSDNKKVYIGDGQQYGGIEVTHTGYTENVYYVTTEGSDLNRGDTIDTAFATVKKACQVASESGSSSTIHVKTGVYSEQLPIVVPENTAILGDSIRNTFVQPAEGLSDDGVTPNNQSTLFQVSDGVIIKNLCMRGMTGFSPSLADPTNIDAATIGGVCVAFNPASPILHKSPYIIECSAFSTGGIGAIVDGSIHSSGNKSMVFHGFTNIHDNGVGLWIKDNGVSEIVSCFTYYAYMGYVASGGGIIRSLNGNNSYGTYGAVSYGYDENEVTQTGVLNGSQLVYDPETLVGTFSVGNTVTGSSSGAIGVITYTSIVYEKLHYTATSGTFQNGEVVTNGLGSSATIMADGATGQKGFTLAVTNLSAEPIPGGSVEFTTGDTGTYVLQNVLSWNPLTSTALLSLANEKGTASPTGSNIKIRYKYSQARLTGHDFLRIGTGGTVTTNYPGVPIQPASQGNEITEQRTGRVYYISTDQDGNFRVGNYFRINQSTGVATLNTSAFDLSGLNTLNVAAFGGISGETINQFSSDSTLSGNSNLTVPTEAAVKQYFTQVATDVKPSINLTYDLGSTTRQWKTLNVGTVNTTALNINSGSLVFEGATDNAFETTLAVVDPTADRTITFPDATTTVVGTDTTQTLTNKTLVGPTFTETAYGANLTLTGNLTVSGTTTTINSTSVSYVDNIINLHNTPDSSPLTTDDGKDVGLRLHYFKTSDKHAFLGWANDTGYLEYYSDATETGGVVTGTYGTIKASKFISDVATGTAPFTVTSTTKVDNLYVARSALADAVTNGVYTTDTGTVTNTMLSGSIANSKLSNSSITVNGQSVSLGGTISITAQSVAALTIGSGLSGTSYDGSAAVTVAIDNTVALRADTTFVGTTSIALNRTSASQDLTGVNIDGSAASLSGNVTAKYFYAGPTSGTAATATWRAISASDIPTLNQNTSGTAGSASTAGTATKATNLAGGNSTTGFGSLPYQSGVDQTSLLAPNTTTTKKFLRMTGSGSTGATPAWDTLVTGDIPSFNLGTTAITFNRASASQSLTGISIDGSAGSVTNGVYTTDTGSVTNTMLSGSIANSKLSNSSITIGTTAISLGNTTATLAGVTSITSVIAATSNMTVATGATTTIASGALAVRSGGVTGNFSSGTITVRSGDSAGSSGIAYLGSGSGTGTQSGAVYLSSGNAASASGDITINAGIAAGPAGIKTGGTIYIVGGTAGGADGTKIGGSVYIDGGSPQTGGTTTIGTVEIGTRNVEFSHGTSAVNIGRSGIITTVLGSLKTTTLTTGAAATAGTITGTWTLSTGSTLNATYADLAEKYVADAEYAPGTVLELGGEFEVTIAEDGTRRVAGIVTTNPAYSMNNDCQGEYIANIALQGRVPCKVRGTVRKGDLLVSAGSGFARASNNPIYGSVIGKAISSFAGVEGIVEVLVGRM